MDRTQRLRTAGGDIDAQGWGGSQQSVIAVLAVSALMVALFAYVILRAGPTLISALGPFVSSLPSERSMHGWIAPSVAAGALLAGGSLAAMGLAAFVKGVRVDPFRWLAPVLIAFSSVVMTRLGLERSMGPLPATLFGALTALLLLGGGVLVQAQGLAVACAGAVLLALPVLGLVLDQAHYARGIENLFLARDPNMVLALLVLCMTSVGVGLTAFVGRPNGAMARSSARSRDTQRLHGQLSMTIERMRASEQRASSMEAHIKTLERALAEQQQGYGASFAAEEAAFAAAARPQNASRWFILLGMMVIGASIGAVGLHVAMVRPLHAQVAGEREAATKALAAREAEVAALRVELSGERAKAGELLKVEHERAAAAAAELKAAQEKAAAIAAQAQAVEPEPAIKREASPAKKRVARAAKRETKREAVKRSAPEAADNSGLRDSVSDDPIGGLE